MHENEKEKTLVEMKDTIDRIEALALELRALGQGAPVVEQNVRNLLSTVYVLKFGISDVAETNTDQGGDDG